MKTIFILSSALLLTSCYSFKPLSQTGTTENKSIEEIVALVQLEEHYRFELNDGKMIIMKVGRIEKELISGLTNDYYNNESKRVHTAELFPVSIPRKHIKSVAKRKVSGGKIALAIIIPVGIVAAIISLDNGLSGPWLPTGTF